MIDSDYQCHCNETEIIEFKRSMSNELGVFSKILSGFENEIRILTKEQTELRELLRGADSHASTTTNTPELVCDDGWIMSPGGKCYYVSTSQEKTEWATAIDRCTAMGADLVEFRTNGEAWFMMRNLPARVSTTDYVYTGRKRNDEGAWVFLSNDERVDISVRSWGDGEPDGGTQECGCTKEDDNFLMWDCFCTGYDLFYICETLPSRARTTTATTTTVTPRVCDDGWITSPEKCYYVSTDSEQTEWATAITRCNAKGANLVEIKSDEEARFIMRTLPYASSDIVYTGRKRNNENDWIFLSNDERVDTSVRSWASGEPDGGSQTCGCVTKSDNFDMHDCVCIGYDLYYICEIMR
ncbi:uncharacterized protein LOC117316692 [Pecten maximus]|uniref:uncharacterized protein LOC117316692 n=1 Tax=Pecten maximus TaxID=6579 RepID=UPI001458E655|nr:uncharacterized protein LOC117316692 [Pecten maximus]